MRINKTKLLSHILILFTLTSCGVLKPISIKYAEIDKIEVYKGYPRTKVKMKDGFEKEFIFDLNQSKNVGPTKYIKTHRFLIYHKNGKIDSLLSNGIIHQFNGYSKSKINLLAKYSEPENSVLSDTINAQLKIAETIKILMDSKKYDVAINLFSLKQQENIKGLQTKKYLIIGAGLGHLMRQSISDISLK